MSKMDDSNADYLTKYREFIESLLKTSDLDFPLPVNVAKYNIAEFEITGEILNWCLTYLNERNCPNSLAAPLCCKVLEEIQQVAKEDPESCGYRTREDDFQPLRLMQKTIKKLVDVCIYYSDNAKLSTLLPPPSSTLLDPPVSLCGVKNSRRKMEDRHVAIQDLHALFNIKDCGSASYYAIFDGHNGVDAAAYSSCHVHQYLVESSHYPHNPELALKEAFQKTDDRFVDKSNKEHLDSGTTALAALIRPNESMLYVAWLGDSQAVLVSQGKAYQLVKPHRPDQPDERLRITRMGGSVLHLGTWRVNGHLAVSRAIGDRKYKPFVVGEPDVRVIPLTGKEEFLILASDGLWDFVPENEAVNAVYHYLQKNKGEVGGISKHLIQLAKSRLSQDNISVVVVFLSEPEPYKGGRMEASEVEHIWRDSYVTKAPNGQFGHDDDDFGPETDVDNVHDVLSSGFPADAAKAKALVVQSQTMEDWLPQRFEPSQKEFLKSLPWTYADALKKPKPKSPDSESSKNSSSHNKDIIIYEIPETLDVSPISKEISKNESADAPEPSETSAEKIDDKTSESKKKSEETGNDVAAEAEVDSADDSEEEWNYIPGRNNKKAEKKQQVEAVERPSDPAEEEDDMSQLNPNAAEFVPVFGAKEDKVLASSPAKGAEKSLENIRVPKQKDFLEEIATKPSELDSDIGFEPQVGEKSVNGIDVSVDSSKPESIDDYDRSEEVENVPPESFNPFNGDRIQMVSDHFSENQSLDFKPFDIMQSSMVVLDSTPSPTNPAGTDLYDFLSNSDKPDLLSPIDNLSNTNNEQQKSSSSGFESESGNDVDVGLADKCDLVAGIPHDNDIDEPQVEAHQTEQIPEYPETNPFSDNATNEIAVERLTEQFLTFGVENVESSCPKEMFTDDALEESKESKPLIDDALEGLSESRPDTIFNNEIEMDKSEEPVNDILAPVGHVDLIIGTVNADSHMSLTPTAESDSPLLLENNELPKSEVLHVESAFNDDVEDIQMNQSIPDERLEEPKEIELDVPAKERDDAPNAVLPVVDDKSKDDSTEIDDFEIISHDDAGVNHVQEMNGGVHLEEVEPSPDNYKFDDLVQQHIVEVHAENSSFGSDFTNCDIRPPSDMHSILEIETPIKTIETVVKQEEAVTEPIGDSDLLSPTNTDELMQDIASASLAVTESIEIKEVTDDSVEEAVQLTESVKEDALIVEEPVEELNIPQPELKQEELVSPVDDVCNQLVHSVRDDLVQSLLEASADDVAVASPLDAGFTQLPENSDNDLVKSSTEEAMVEAAASIKTETAPSEIPESLPVTPSAPFSEELLQDVIPNKETFDEVPKEVEQKSETQETQENVIEEIQADDFHSQNGYIADVSTPPSTPAPGVELDNKDGLIAAAVAAAGVASIAAAATAISGTAKPDDKAAKKPAPKPLSSARPSSAKAPAAKPGTTTAGTKKPATTSVASKAPVTATKTTAAKPLSTAKPSTTKPATTATKPASPLTKTTTTSTTAKPKPATTSAAKPTATKSTVGATAKPPTPTSRTAPVASKTAPLAKPKTPTTATPAPIRKPAAPGTTTKTTPAAPAAAKKPELTKPPVSKAAPVAKTTVAAPRPSSASKPTTATTARPTSATKPAARPVTSTTTKMAASTTTKPAGATKPAVAKTPATTTAATKTSTATKAAPTKAAPPKPKPAVPTVLKKPAPADKNAKDSANKSAAPRGPIKKPVSDKTKVPDKDTKTTGGEPEKIIEPLMQEPIVSTTNGHIDLIENGVSHSDESPVDVNSCPIIEAQN